MVVIWNDNKNEFCVCQANHVAGAVAKMSAWGVQENNKIKLIIWGLFFIFVIVQYYMRMSSLHSPIPDWYFCEYFKMAFVSKYKKQTKVHHFKVTLWDSYI